MLCEDPPSRHAIELSTLKYEDSNPVDQTLLAHRLPPPPPVPGRSSNRQVTTRAGPGGFPEDNLGNMLGTTFARDREAACGVNRKKSLVTDNFGNNPHQQPQRQQQEQQQQRQHLQQQQQQQQQQQRQRQLSIVPPYAQSNLLNPSGDGVIVPPIRRLSCVSAMITHPHQPQQHQQQQRHSGTSGGGGGGGVAVSGVGTGTSGSAAGALPPPPPPRRLPDYVTVDQCYSAAAGGDQDCSTVCLIANFDVGGRDFGGGGGGGGTNTNAINNNTNFNNNNNLNNNNNAVISNYISSASRRGTITAGTLQQHHQLLQQLQQQQQQQQQQQHQQQQHPQQVDSSGSSGGAPGARKERSSLRRGIMMRQMSLNPSHERDIHLLTGKN